MPIRAGIKAPITIKQGEIVKVLTDHKDASLTTYFTLADNLKKKYGLELITTISDNGKVFFLIYNKGIYKEIAILPGEILGKVLLESR